MADQTLKQQLLTEWQSYTDESQVQNVQKRQEYEQRKTDELKVLIQQTLHITEGISITVPDVAEATIEGLPGIKFYAAGPHLYVTPILPAVDVDTPAYDEWWTNPENEGIPLGRNIDNRIDLGRLLHELDTYGPITIHPWPKDLTRLGPDAVGQGRPAYDYVEGEDALIERLNADGWEYVATLQQETPDIYARFLIRKG